MRTRALSLILLTSFEAGCASEAPEILLWVEADYPMAANSRAVKVTIAESGEQVVPLLGDTPKCLPFSFSIVKAEDTDLDAPIELIVQIERLDGDFVTRRIATRFGSGLRELRVHFEERCAFADDCDRTDTVPELPARDRAEALQDIEATSCLPLPTPIECVAQGGCLALASALAPVCVTPCPTPSEVEAPAPPLMPLLPSPPSPWTCDPGWSPVVQDNLQFCQPWPREVPACPLGTARIPGDPECQPLSGPCPSGSFPTPLPAGAQVVSATSGPGLEAVLRSANPGTTVVLGRGTHRANALAIDRPLQIIGACTAETILELAGGEVLITAGPTSLSALTIRGAGTGVRVNGVAATLEGLQIDGPSYEGIRANDGAVLTLRGISVRNSGGTGLRVEGSTVSAERVELYRTTSSGARISGSRADLRAVAITGVVPGSDAGIGTGSGLLLRHESSVVGEGLVISGAFDWGMQVREASTLSLTRSLSREESGSTAGGIRIAEGSEVVVDHGAIDGAADAGIYVNAGAALRGSHLYLADLRSEQPGHRGTGVICSSSGQLELSRAVIVRASRYGINAGSGCRARLHDLELRTIGETSDGGDALYFQDASLLLERALISSPRDRAISLEERAVAQIVDLTALAEGRGEDPGIYLAPTADLQLSEAAFAGFDEGLVSSARSSTTPVTLSDLYLEDVRGYGIRISGTEQRRTKISITRADLRRVGGRGLDLSNVDAELEDLSVRDSGFGEPNYSGAGVALLTSSVVGRRWSVQNVDDASIVVLGGEIELEDVEGVGTSCRPSPLPQACGVYSATGLHLGIGLGRIFPETVVSVRRFRFAEHQIGIRQADGLLQLQDGVVEESRIGILSDYEGRDLERLLSGVNLRTNEQDLNLIDD
ncbi:MAG: right-handed parallel beta-helix repeat-containing protein [Deltaproteobacteria bacterium]|nr:right-handed parallel beta-helix repeat-containing protein [Deltaproteobacteria bacterium]